MQWRETAVYLTSSSEYRRTMLSLHRARAMSRVSDRKLVNTFVQLQSLHAHLGMPLLMM